MTSIDIAIETTKYCLKQIKKERSAWYGEDFIHNSYSIWAAKELLSRLNASRDTPPLITLENFEELMSEYACKYNKESLFTCAKEVTQWIINLLIS